MPGAGPAEPADRTTRPPPRHKAPEWIGPYRVIERTAAGGMGEVFKAEQRHPIQRIVAVKLIKLGMDSERVIARFEAERQALAHPRDPRMIHHPTRGFQTQGGLISRWSSCRGSLSRSSATGTA